MNAKEFIGHKIQNDWDGKIYLGFYEDEEVDIFEMMELYAQFKAENLPISGVVGQIEQLKLLDADLTKALNNLTKSKVGNKPTKKRF